MVRLPTLVLPDKPCDKTASAALMKGWISSIFMDLSSRSSGASYGTIFAHHVFDDFVEHFRLHRLLHEMARAALQCRHNVFLIAHRRHHDNAGFGMLLHDPFSRLDPFHLRHGDIHEHDVRMHAVELADGGQAVAGLSRHLPAERLDHAGQILAGKHGVVHDQIADRLTVFATFYWCELLHSQTSPCTSYHAGVLPARSLKSPYLLLLNCCIHSTSGLQLPAFIARPGMLMSARASLRPQIACRVADITSRATTRTAYPRSMAALGMP